MYIRCILLALFLTSFFTASFSLSSDEFSFSNLEGDEKLDAMYNKALEVVVSNPYVADSIGHEMLEMVDDKQFGYKGLAYFVCGEAHYYKEQYDLALERYQDAEKFLKFTDDTARLAATYSNIGLINLYKADYKTSLMYYEKSYDLEMQLNDSVGMAQTLQNMGLIVGKWDKFELQSSYYKKALALYKKLGEHRSIADMALNLGVTYVAQDELKEGFKYYQEALEFYQQLNDSNRIASVYNNMACYYTRVQKFDDAEKYFNNSIDIFSRINKKSGLISAYTGLGDLFAEKGNYQAAIEMYKKCEEVNKEVGLLGTQGENLYSLYETYKGMGDTENALRVFEQYHQIVDSIYSMEQFDKILELENKYILQRSQGQVTELRAKNRLYTIVFLSIAFFVIFGGVVVYFYSRDKGMKEKQRLLSLEQKVLRTQMNPHFIFNSLSAIQCYVLENKTMDAVDFLADFASLMRMVLHYSQEEFISLEQEREILDFYIDLQNKRFGDKVKYQIVIDEKLEKSKVKIPPMLAQPFIENSFEHGELCKREDGHILVRFEKKGKNLSYQIEDNGIGILSTRKGSNSPTTKKHKSLALKITKERLKLINKNHLANRVDLLVEDRSKYGTNGTRVEFTIPLRELK
ncbi:tetratricopeptide repeat-containing sensor histidine kinase [Labilibacter marinus]|uniref:tetratricopeptide repeat-containing sensor histidine kinase n=1 Tax=Labilibacter marinus TaxID=1477105 RepID=UPI00095010B3|nr:tetratricopeptide repeat protein [Labilibacter marinus]